MQFSLFGNDGTTELYQSFLVYIAIHVNAMGDGGQRNLAKFLVDQRR
jgi:hypothetical protein